MRTLLLSLVLLMGLGLNAQRAQIISSKILDEQSKEPISFATIHFENSSKGSISDRQGFFEVEVRSGLKEITVSCVGYKSRVFKIKNLPKEIYLKEATDLLDVVVVSAGRTKQLKKRYSCGDVYNFYKGIRSNKTSVY